MLKDQPSIILYVQQNHKPSQEALRLVKAALPEGSYWVQPYNPVKGAPVTYGFDLPFMNVNGSKYYGLAAVKKVLAKWEKAKRHLGVLIDIVSVSIDDGFNPRAILERYRATSDERMERLTKAVKLMK
ncbi:MAG: hypothetical protein HYT14_02905 [Candidatus Liptonbacteria bacterium]|nr:hypothetical protein [Candidatus Liptonbacteria bacterium]